MPEKEGAEEKTTKSVVNKKQKQMMGEEGYDVARDEGRVKPSKDKKDGTTMPPSKEMEKLFFLLWLIERLNQMID